MTTPPADLRRLRHDEYVRSAWWLFAVLGLMLGGTAGGMTGVAIKGLIDEPLLTGVEAVIFYLAFGLSALFSLFVLLNFSGLIVTASDAGLEIRFGLFGKRWAWDEIEEAEAQPYRWLRFGGWGIRYGTGGRRAWSVPGVSTGIEIRVNENDSTRHYYISSRRPAEFAAAINAALSSPGTQPGATTST